MMTRSKTKVRYAVVGLGHIAQVAVLPAFKTAHNAELVALVSGDGKKLEEVGKKYKLAHLYPYEEYSRALSNVDAVYLTVPNHLHREYAVRAAAAGVHVLCEKPMAPTPHECHEMIDAANQNHVKLMIAYRLHFEGGNLAAIRLAQSGKLGEVRMFTSEFAQQVADGNIRVTEPAPRGGGPLYDMGVYCINAARYLFRAEPMEVCALAESRISDDRFERVDEMISAVLRFPGERLATFSCSFGAADVSRYTLLGTKGLLRADPAYEYAEGIRLEVTIDRKKILKSFPKRDQFAAELTYFSNCVLRNKEPEPSGLEGLEDIRIIEAIYHSIRTRRTVAIPALKVEKRPSVGQEIHRPAHAKPEVYDAPSASHEAA
jgi:glucose-fructose oxidoreductase